MRTIHLSHPYEKQMIPTENIVLVLGFFDGVHLGHQRVIERAKEEAKTKDASLAIMTFDRHPKGLFQKPPKRDYKYITLLERRLELFEWMGVDLCYVIKFDEAFGYQKPESFIENYIVQLHAVSVVAGFDYTYGPAEIANMKTLPVHAKGQFDVICVEKHELDGEKVASRSIKSYIKERNILKANEQLGYAFQIEGEVIHGFKRGRQIGYPTANLNVDERQLLPGTGVFICEIKVKDSWYHAMTSVGYNITFQEKIDLSVEVYILDFDEMIYGEIVQLRWLDYIRPEIKFDSVDALIQQLDQDHLDTIKFFKSHQHLKAVNNLD